MKSKKGFTLLQLLISVVLGMFILFILLSFTSGIGKKGLESSLNAKCKASVQAYAGTVRIPFSENKDASKINCPTKYIKIKKARDTRMKKAFADQMSECWNNFGEGKLQIFKAQDTKFCAICSVIEFENKNTELKAFDNYLLTRKVPIKYGGKKQTYYDYISDVKGSPDLIEKISAQRTNYLSGKKQYGIIFTFYKESVWGQIRTAITIGAAVLGAGAIAIITGGIGTPISALIVGAAAAGAAGTAATGTEGAEGYDWEARLIVAEYNKEMIKNLGCEHLPISQLPAAFRK